MNQRNSILFLVLVVILAVGAVAYIFFQNKNTTTFLNRDLVITTPATNQETKEMTVFPTSGETSQTTQTVVTIESETSLPQNDVAQLRTKVIEPFVLYYQEDPSSQTATGKLTSLKISVNTQASKNEYPYLLNALFENGGNQGSVIGRKNGEIDWWIPTCMGSCPLSENFKTKYPEIAKQVSQ